MVFTRSQVAKRASTQELITFYMYNAVEYLWPINWTSSAWDSDRTSWLNYNFRGIFAYFPGFLSCCLKWIIKNFDDFLPKLHPGIWVWNSKLQIKMVHFEEMFLAQGATYLYPLKEIANRGQLFYFMQVAQTHTYRYISRDISISQDKKYPVYVFTFSNTNMISTSGAIVLILVYIRYR